MWPPSSESKIDPSKNSIKRAELHAGFFLDLLFNPEAGGDMFFRNISQFSTYYTALYPRR
jgi:hypothetical protein